LAFKEIFMSGFFDFLKEDKPEVICVCHPVVEESEPPPEPPSGVLEAVLVGWLFWQ
jgi:hypothetical protein